MNNAQLVLFDTVFMNLLALNREVRNQCPDLITKDSPIEAFRDFASICFDPGQRTGKSVWLSQAAKRYDAVVTMSNAQFAFYPNCAARMYDMPYIQSLGTEEKFLNFRYVFVEQHRLYAPKDMAKIYQLFGDTDTIFVLL